MSEQDEQLVRHAFAMAGLHPPEEDLAGFVAAYPALRAMAESMYEVVEAKNEFPELVCDVRR